jgi:hypothetical protein
MEIRGLTVKERNDLIDAGLDPMYSEHPDPRTETAAYLFFTRKMSLWIGEHVLGLDVEQCDDHQLMDDTRKVMDLTIQGEQAAEKN